ncbi:hypothetical protein [uncultured Paracoccus sp.]|uniref:hypothetical protein n=1 Tax=uncultured Paracoccus sp. TaxID=189685 RepID=UPI0025F7C510|nr:hypothetical protein [uncultured Paracoccus sp.]
MAKALFSIAQDTARPIQVTHRPRRAAADMGTVMRAMLMATRPEPVFLPANDPVGDGRAYPAVDGTQFARQTLSLAQRGGNFPGPDVAFLKEIDGSVFLHVGLHEGLPGGVPDGTLPLGVPSGPMRLTWAGGEFVLPEPTPIEDDEGSGGLRILAPLAPDQVAMLVQAMTDPAAGCALVATYAASYRISEEIAVIVVPVGPPVILDPPPPPEEPVERPAVRMCPALRMKFRSPSRPTSSAGHRRSCICRSNRRESACRWRPSWPTRHSPRRPSLTPPSLSRAERAARAASTRR